MDFIEQAKAVATMAIPGPGTPEAEKRAFDALPVAELASVWCALQRVGTRDMTDGTWAATLYFDQLPHEAAGRALELVLAVLSAETDKSIRMQLNNRLMTTLLHVHGPTLIERLESEAQSNAALRWLIGGVHWWGSDDALKARLRAVADIEAWDADKEAHDKPLRALDYESLPLRELALAWIEQQSKPDKDRDDNWHNLSSYELDLKNNDPGKAIDLVLEVLKTETNGMMLSVLAAGLLEEAIGAETIGRIEREAAANDKFRDLLGGVWYTGQPDDVKARLDAIVQGKRR